MSNVYWYPWAAEWLRYAKRRREIAESYKRRLRRNRDGKRRKRRLLRASK